MVLRDYRVRAGLTQVGLARLVRVSPPTISFIEQGRQRPSIRLLARLVRVLEIEPEDLKRWVLSYDD